MRRRLPWKCAGAMFVLWFAAIVPASAGGPQQEGSAVAADGLVWMRCAIGQEWHPATRRCSGQTKALSWSDAVKAAASFNAAGGSDWRLPEVEELASLIDDSRAAPAIRAELFPDTPLERFWSATPVAGFAGYGWTVNFADGSTGFDIRLFANRVRLVRTGKP